MSESRSHRTTANRIAKKLKTNYNSGKGADVKSAKATIEVETLETVSDAPGQLRGHRGPAYIAGTNQAAVQEALKVTQGTTIGVMDNQGKVVKKSTRKE
ncbi:hypothetical protein ACFL6W_07950 [Thermodesulfobacteriota bacterium]